MSGVTDLSRHVAILLSSYRCWTGKLLLPPGVQDEAAAQWLDAAPFALVSHDTREDPIFNYANRAALQLFGMSWEQFTAMPSRFSAGPMDRDERECLLRRVNRDGYIDDYSGIRIAADGRHFMIRNATVWNLLDEENRYYGQAAMILDWNALA